MCVCEGGEEGGGDAKGRGEKWRSRAHNHLIRGEVRTVNHLDLVALVDENAIRLYREVAYALSNSHLRSICLRENGYFFGLQVDAVSILVKAKTEVSLGFSDKLLNSITCWHYVAWKANSGDTQIYRGTMLKSIHISVEDSFENPELIKGI